MRDELAPIVLFVYGRPEHTQKTLQALKRNQLADASELFIFADGPKESCSDLQLQKIAEVRRLIRREKWCGKVEIIESACNQGLAASIVGGVTKITSTYGRAIVLEDDLVTSPGFLPYMNNSLRIYADDERVMHVSGFNFATRFWAPSTGFLRASHPWGWSTWHRAWQHFRNDADGLLAEIQARDPIAFDLDGTAFHLEELQQNVTGELKTWAVRWYASIFLKNGLCLYPRVSLVRNIGFDGTGENCHADREFYEQIPISFKTAVNRIPIKESDLYLIAHQNHYRRQLKRWTKTTFRDRAMRKLAKLLNKFSLGLIKTTAL
jgi:hypothetical protein